MVLFPDPSGAKSKKNNSALAAAWIKELECVHISGVARVQQLPGHLVGVSPPHSRGVWGHAPPEIYF